jgi:hypothetical protein
MNDAWRYNFAFEVNQLVLLTQTTTTSTTAQFRTIHLIVPGSVIGTDG